MSRQSQSREHFFRRTSKANLASLTMIIVVPKTVTELIGPYGLD